MQIIFNFLKRLLTICMLTGVMTVPAHAFYWRDCQENWKESDARHSCSLVTYQWVSDTSQCQITASCKDNSDRWVHSTIITNLDSVKKISNCNGRLKEGESSL